MSTIAYDKPKAIHEVASETIAIERHLKTLEEGDVATYAQLSDICGRDVRRKGYHNLRTAIKRLEKQSLCFDAVAGIGVKRLTPSEALTLADSALRSLGRKSRRAARTLLDACDYTRLDDTGKARWQACVAILKAAEHVVQQKNVAKIQSIAKGNHQRIPISRTLEYLGE